MKNWRLMAAGLALGMVAVQAVAQPQKPLRKVSMGLLYLAADSGAFLAKDRGYFAEQGLDVEFTRFSSGGDMVALLATNRLDVGSGSATPGLFNSYIRGAVAPITSSKAILSKDDVVGAGILVRRDLWDSGKVKGVADLKGMRIVLNNIQSTSINYVLRPVLAAGLGKDDVTLVEMPFEQFIPAMQKQAVEAVLTFSPLTNTIADRMKLGVRVPGSATGITSAGDTANMMFYSANFGKSDVARAFMVAHLKGQRDYHRALFTPKGDKNAVCAMLNKHLPFVPPDCSGIQMSQTDPDGQVNLKSLERFQDEWAQWGLMREKANIAANVNMEYVNFAVKQLGPYRP